jgi:hypothetical protein
MNIFYLHPDPLTAAQMHCDKHCVKMILETAQMLCTAHRALDGDDSADYNGMYKTAHLNHPSTRWVRDSWDQYEWTYKLFEALCDEYSKRYNKIHQSDKKLRHILDTVPYFIKPNGFREPPQCMPDQYKVPDDSVQAYRNYYIGEKASFAKWQYSEIPNWWTNNETVHD